MNKISSNKTKYLEVPKKLINPATIDYNFFLSNDGSQNIFVYQPTLDTLELKKDKGTDYVFSSKGVYTSKLKSLHTAYLHSKRIFGYRVGIKSDNDLLAAEKKEKKKYATKILNVHIVYNLDVWQRHPTNNFTFKNYWFGATNFVKIVIKKSVCIVATE